MLHSPDKVFVRLFPEYNIASFFRRWDRFVFFSMVADLITRESIVLDYGAGRGAHVEKEFGHMGHLTNLRGRVKKIIGVDPDAAVLDNPTLDEAFGYEPSRFDPPSRRQRGYCILLGSIGACDGSQPAGVRD